MARKPRNDWGDIVHEYGLHRMPKAPGALTAQKHPVVVTKGFWSGLYDARKGRVSGIEQHIPLPFDYGGWDLEGNGPAGIDPISADLTETVIVQLSPVGGQGFDKAAFDGRVIGDGGHYGDQVGGSVGRIEMDEEFDSSERQRRGRVDHTHAGEVPTPIKESRTLSGER